MDNNSIIKYIKTNYPKIIFNPVKITDVSINHSSKALGFIINNNKLIIGFIAKNGNLCKLIEPIDLSLISNLNFEELIKKIPLVEGFTEDNKKELIRTLSNNNSISMIEHENIINELKNTCNQNKNVDYTIYNDEKESILIKKKYDKYINELIEKHILEVNELKNKQNDLEYMYDKCKRKLITILATKACFLSRVIATR